MVILIGLEGSFIVVLGGNKGGKLGLHLSLF